MMSRSPLTTVRNRIEWLTQLAYREVPLPAAFAGMSFIALEQLGERATSTRKRRITLLSLAGMMMLSGPAAAQSCGGDGILSFLSNLHDIIAKSAGVLLISMIIIAGIMKMIPSHGTNSIGNALIGGVFVGIVFLVLGPALVDIAGKSSPINMNNQC